MRRRSHRRRDGRGHGGAAPRAAAAASGDGPAQRRDRRRRLVRRAAPLDLFAAAGRCAPPASRSVSGSSTSTHPTLMRRARRPPSRPSPGSRSGPRRGRRARPGRRPRPWRPGRRASATTWCARVRLAGRRRAARGTRRHRTVVAMPTLRVRRGEHAVVAGTAPTTRLAEHVAVVDRRPSRPGQQWHGTPERVLVLAPATAAEADALLGRAPGSGPRRWPPPPRGPVGPGGTATGDRVVLDPAAFGRLTASGRESCSPTSWPTWPCGHRAGRPAGWLTEGYADHVGYACADCRPAAPRPAR